METATKHKADCKRVFRNYDLDCHRCQELMAGLPARLGWSRPQPVYDFKTCGHGSHNLNPGGYCNVCGNGRDFS